MMEFHQQLNGMGFQQSERTIRRYIDKLKKEGIISSGQAPNSNPSFTVDYQHGVNSYTHDDTTPYGQASNSNPSFTHDDTTPYGQGPSSNPYTHDDTTPYGQASNSNPSFTVDYQHGVNSYTHDDTTPYGQASNSNQQAINYQTNEYENNTYWRNTHHSNDQVKLPHHGDDYKHWMVENE
ncbi:hypothetical protein GPALN_011724 [Globodera pallida]|nr:hypothetical protein GPALN_011724 [Globodera pallida]